MPESLGYRTSQPGGDGSWTLARRSFIWREEELLSAGLGCGYGKVRRGRDGRYLCRLKCENRGLRIDAFETKDAMIRTLVVDGDAMNCNG